MSKPGCALVLIVVVAIGGGLLHYVLSVFEAFQWIASGGESPTGWAGDVVTAVVVLAFMIGFVLIMRMPDSETTPSDGDPPAS